MKLSIIIVNYNVKYFLEQCLYAVQQAIRSIETEVFVVDNCSTDGSIAYLQQKHPWVRFIANEKNEGFGKACNKALFKCKGDFVLFLNPDTIVPEQIFLESIRFFDMHADAGCIGVRMLDGIGVFLPESKRAFPSPLVSFFKLSGLSALFPKSSFFNRYALGFLDESTVHEVDTLCGAYMMGRRDLLQSLNGFEEDFFMYGEDIDLSYRVQKAGKKNYYLGHLAIIHFKGESSGKNKSRHIRYFYNAMQIFVSKHYTGLRAFILKMLLYAGIAIRAFISLLAWPVRLLLNNTVAAFTNSHKDLHLIGDAHSMEEAEKIVLTHKLKKTFRGSMLVDKKEYFTNVAGAKIIFCTGRTFSFTEAIQILLANPRSNDYKWHALHSGSIVGSSNKKLNGIVYFKETDTAINELLTVIKPAADLLHDMHTAERILKVQVSDTTKA